MKFLKPLLPILAATLVSVGVVQATMYKWSQTAANNANSDSFTWAEGQAPSTVNDSARGMMAAIAKYRDDVSGKLVTGGISTAYTITSNQVFTTLALMDGAELSFRMSATSGAAPTLNVDTLGAKALNQATGIAVPTGALISGAVYSAVYVNASNEWIVRGLAGTVPSGTSLVSATTCPTGWTTGATHNDKALRLMTSSPGTAAGSFAFSTIFGQTVTGGTAITQANLPAVNFNSNGDFGVSDPTHFHSLGITAVADGGSNFSAVTAGSQATRAMSQASFATQTGATATGISISGGSVSSGGSGSAHTHAFDTRVQYLQVVLCVKD
jgi:hypothetical protein